MPRRRRDREEQVVGGGFGREAPSRRAPLYAVLARELLRHLGEPPAQVASVGPARPAVLGTQLASQPARITLAGPLPTADIVDRTVDRDQGRLLAAMRVLRGGRSGTDLRPTPPLATIEGLEQLHGEHDGIRPLEIRPLGPRLVGAPLGEDLSARVDASLRRGPGDDTNADLRASAGGTLGEDLRRVVCPRG